MDKNKILNIALGLILGGLILGGIYFVYTLGTRLSAVEQGLGGVVNFLQQTQTAK